VTVRVTQRLEFGDVAGHDFHGNQWTSGFADRREWDGDLRNAMAPVTPGTVTWNAKWYKENLTPEQLKDATGIKKELGGISKGFFAPDQKDDFAKIRSSGREWTEPVHMSEYKRPGYCHWNSAEMWTEDPDRYHVVTGYALANGAMVPMKGIDLPDEAWDPKTGKIIPEYRDEAMSKMEDETRWIAHSWIHDTKEDRIIETTGNSYGRYFGAELTGHETLGFIKDISEVKRVPVPKDVRARFKNADA
jgi:hypothetical protein